MIFEFVKGEESDFLSVLRRIRKRDFSGTAGKMIKNSFYESSTNILSKIGALILTIILARLLLPDLFGLYNLALSTILIFSTLSNFGIGQAMVRFVSIELGKGRKKKAKAYAMHFLKVRLIIITFSVLSLLITSRFISEVIYRKPIFLALIAGVFYVTFIQIFEFFQATFQASNYFKGIFQKEIVLQSSKLILASLATIASLRYGLSNESTMFFIFIAISLSYLIVTLFMFVIALKKFDFLKEKKATLSKRDSGSANKFMVVTGTFIFSGVFFSYIDKAMLGYFVQGEFIGYYAAAFSLIGGISSITSFGAVLLPVFSRMGASKKAKKILKKSFSATIAIGLASFLATLGLSYWLIIIIFGSEYLPAVNLLRMLSPLLILLPPINVYTSYLLSRKKLGIINTALISSALTNVVLNYLLISSLLNYGELAAVFGAGISTILSQILFLFLLVRIKGFGK